MNIDALSLLRSTSLSTNHYHDAKREHAYAQTTRPTAASTTERKTPLCEVLTAAPLKGTGVVDVGVDPAGTTALEEPATPATPGTTVAAGAGAAVAAASLGAGVPAARPTLLPEVAKWI